MAYITSVHKTSVKTRLLTLDDVYVFNPDDGQVYVNYGMQIYILYDDKPNEYDIFELNDRSNMEKLSYYISKKMVFIKLSDFM